MSTAYQDLAEKIFYLEQRVSRLEAGKKAFYLPSTEEEKSEEEIQTKAEQEVETQIESTIGEYGLAWIGNIVLFFGIIFFVEYLRVSGLAIASHLTGIAASVSIFALAYYFRKTNPNMANIFSMNAYMLTFYVILKLHFFNSNPVIADKTAELALLIAISGLMLFLSIQRKYAVLSGLSLVFLATTAILSNSNHLMLSLMDIIAIISLILMYRFGWIKIAFLSITLVYFVHLLWILNNPIMSHSLQIITDHHYGFVHLFAATTIFSLIALIPERKRSAYSDYITVAVIFNGLGFAFITALTVLSFFKSNYYLPLGVVALFLITYAVILDYHSSGKINAALYVLSGFVALSICIHGIYEFPRAYILLAVQSLLVVSIAIWFRSKFIVVMNSLMYLFLLALYLLAGDSGDGINIAFSIVALLTARILNWKKERLTIQTDLIRNLYLVTAFFIVLYTLYHLIPKEYITLSWTVAAVVYFLLSLILKNVKYRYMALATMISAAFYFFIVDLARVELIYRVIALLFLATISIGLSFYYYNRKQIRQSKD